MGTMEGPGSLSTVMGSKEVSIPKGLTLRHKVEYFFVLAFLSQNGYRHRVLRGREDTMSSEELWAFVQGGGQVHGLSADFEGGEEQDESESERPLAGQAAGK